MKSRLLSALGTLLLAPTVSAIIDTNNNGLSDLWERAYSEDLEPFDETFDPQADPDADGWTNGQEAAAGTDPFDPNPPDGLVQPETAHIPAVYELDENGVLQLKTPEAVTVTWPTIVGKQYTLLFSPDLSAESWFPVGAPYIGNGNDFVYAFENNDTDSRFWPVAVTDVDTDSDGLTDHEEGRLGTDPLNPATLMGIPDLWLATHFANSLLAGGPGSIDINADPDSDGSTTVEELLGGTDPNAADAPAAQHWLAVHGVGEENQQISRTRQFTIAPGQSVLVVVAISSDEYPYWTDPLTSSEYNDLLTWDIEPEGSSTIEGEVNVNDRHTHWEVSEALGTSLPGLPGPVHFETISVITAPIASSVTINVGVSATNIGDENLPSHLAVGLLPIDVLVPHLDEEGEEIDGEFVIAEHLRVAKWEHAFTGTHAGDGAVKDDFIGLDKDRFYLRVACGVNLGITTAEIATTDNPDNAYN